MAMIDYGGTGGTTDPWDDDEGSTDSDDSTTFSTGSDTFSTTSLGTSTGTEDDTTDWEVEDTSDPDASSPAGGQGETSAVADFIGADEEEVSAYEEDGGDALDLSQEVSDTWTERRRQAREMGIETDAAEAVGSIFDGDGVLDAQLDAQTAAVEEMIEERAEELLPEDVLDALEGTGVSPGLLVTLLAVGGLGTVGVVLRG